MKNLPCWGFAKLEERNGKLTKVPYRANGSHAKANDLTTFGDFDTALAALIACDDPHALCLGFLLQPPFMVIDLDLGKMNPDEAKQCENDFDTAVGSTYKEHSQSGDGVHYFIKSDMPLPRKKHGHVEMYTSGRFIALTGNAVTPMLKVATVSGENLAPVYEKYIPDRSPKKAAISVTLPQPAPLDISDSELIQKARNAANGNLFSSLFDGKYSHAAYKSPSDADGALSILLAFWTQHDPVRMDDIFRQSALMRPKWDEKRGTRTYGQITIDTALETQKDDYRPKINSALAANIDALQELQNNSTKKPTKFMRYTDTGSRDRFLADDTRKKHFLYDAETKQVMYYNNAVWKPDKAQSHIMRAFEQMADNVVFEPLHLAPELAGDPDIEDKARKARAKYIDKIHNRRGVMDGIEIIKGSITVESDPWDKKPRLLNTPAGEIVLGEDKWTKRDHVGTDYLTQITPVSPSKESAAPRWLKFINEVTEGDTEKAKFLQRLAGYSLLGNNPEQIMVFIYGEGDENNGSNGKSVFVQALHDALGDDYAAGIKAETLAESRYDADGNSANNDIVALENKRFGHAAELKEGQKLAEARVKKLTGGETFPVRANYGEQHDIALATTIWMTTNRLAIVHGLDYAIWRRMIFIPFTACFKGKDVDTGLGVKLKSERAGILTWMLNGYNDYCARGGLDIPESIKRNNGAFKDDADVVQQFVDDCIIEEDGLFLLSRFVGEMFEVWSEENGVKMSPQTFVALFKNHYKQRQQRINNARGFKDMGLNTENGVPPKAGRMPTSKQ